MAAFRFPLGSMTLSSILPVFEVTTRMDVQRRLTLCAVAIERYRIKQGKSPECLDDLIPSILAEVPVDPFDGTLTRYLCKENGFLLYSVGADGVDDQGEGDKSGPDQSLEITHPKMD